ncbi:TonB-dependent receptor plug domain-containing protein [Undibacterium sp. Ji42W]|uniref:TonB-dependent receptor plug domain-containing protein n=1 Tax=Undibacterium sp. Ji42W TaxID=3413039 RepID=UPI003BF0296A
MPQKRIYAAVCSALLLLLSPVSALALEGDAELPVLSLEQLSEVVITSLSRQEERLGNAAASIYIISAAEIARSGARSLPEALRLAPNLQVSRVDARNYAITARGFNSAFENKLLVLIDGRSIYSPLFSGVFWDAQDVLMADIERIEVISGPGATIYGANAVNGVISIITKSAKDTQDGVLGFVGGSKDRVGGFRYGGELFDKGYYRIYAKATEVDDTFTAAGGNTHTGFRRLQAGFRSDWLIRNYGISLSGDAYSGELGQTSTADIHISGANLTGALNSKLDNGSDLHLGVIFDHTERNQPNAFAERLGTVDLQAQHNLHLGDTHRFSWGGAYRYSSDRISNGQGFGFLPGDLSMHWGSVFAQDEIAIDKRLKVTIGLKSEHNNYTAWEHLPNVRLAWMPDQSKLIWTSLSRTVRAPSRIDRDFYSPTNPPVVNSIPQFGIAGGPDFQSEVAKVLEIGYRAQLDNGFSYSLTAFTSRYDSLRTLEPQTSGGAVFQNMGEGRTRGLEAWWRWQPVSKWRLSGGLVVQNITTQLKAGSKDSSASSGLANNDPRRHWTLRSSSDLSQNQQLDVSLRYNSELSNPAVPAYYEMDAQWSWRVRPDVDVALIGQNLLHATHTEFGGLAGRSVFDRAVLLKISKRF